MHITLHMATSLDGRITAQNWPKEDNISGVYEDIHRELKGDAWLVGRVTMGEFAQGTPNPVKADKSFPRQTWKAPEATQGPYAVVIDRRGTLHLNRSKVNGDALVAILTSAASDDHLAELQRDGISYLFAGDHEVDLPLALSLLEREFGIARLLLEGGGTINGAFLDDDLIDDISLLLTPYADGAPGAQTLFDRQAPHVAKAFTLVSATPLPDNFVHVRYKRKD